MSQVQKHIFAWCLGVLQLNKWLHNRNVWMCLGHDDSWIKQIRALYWVWGLLGLFIYATIFILEDVCAWGLFNFCCHKDDDVFTDPEGLYLSQFLLDGGSLGVPQHLYRMHMEVDDTSSLAPSHPPQSHSPSHSHSPLDTQRPPQEQRISPSEGPVRHADSISLSEDEVFYNWSFDDTAEQKEKRFFVYSLCSLMRERRTWGYVWGYRFTVKVCNSYSWASSTSKERRDRCTCGHVNSFTYHIAFLQMKASPFAVMMLEIGL